MNITTRWMIQRDIPDVLAIEQEAFDAPENEEFFRAALKHKATIAVTAEQGAVVAGYMVYSLSTTSIEVRRLAVAPWCRLNGIGRLLLMILAEKLRIGSRISIGINVPEEMLHVQKWLRAIGWRAERVVRTPAGVCYRFLYRLWNKRVAGSATKRGEMLR